MKQPDFRTQGIGINEGLKFLLLSSYREIKISIRRVVATGNSSALNHVKNKRRNINYFWSCRDPICWKSFHYLIMKPVLKTS